MKFIQKFLPEHCYSQRERVTTDLIVEHHISGIQKFKKDGVIDRLKAYDMQECWQIMADYGVSAHFLTGRCGTTWQLVPMANIAYHAGKSEWDGRTGCNKFSIGHELVGSVLDEYTPSQYAATKDLLAFLMVKYGLSFDQIAGHRDIATPKGRKVDPNKGFDWEDLEAALGNINRA